MLVFLGVCGSISGVSAKRRGSHFLGTRHLCIFSQHAGRSCNSTCHVSVHLQRITPCYCPQLLEFHFWLKREMATFVGAGLAYCWKAVIGAGQVLLPGFQDLFPMDMYLLHNLLCQGSACASVDRSYSIRHVSECRH